MNFLAGYKTYVVAGLAILGSIFGVLDGDLTLQNGLQAILTAVLGITIRSGVTTEANK